MRSPFTERTNNRTLAYQIREKLVRTIHSAVIWRGEPACVYRLWYKEKREKRLEVYSTSEWRQLRGLLPPFATRYAIKAYVEILIARSLYISKVQVHS